MSVNITPASSISDSDIDTIASTYEGTPQQNALLGTLDAATQERIKMRIQQKRSRDLLARNLNEEDRKMEMDAVGMNHTPLIHGATPQFLRQAATPAAMNYTPNAAAAKQWIKSSLAIPEGKEVELSTSFLQDLDSLVSKMEGQIRYWRKRSRIADQRNVWAKARQAEILDKFVKTKNALRTERLGQPYDAIRPWTFALQLANARTGGYGGKYRGLKGRYY